MLNKTLKKISKSQGGFTLVEVLVSAGILGVAIMSLIQLFIYCSLLSDLSGNMTIAINQAQSKMDAMRNSTYSSITTNYASGGSPGNTFAVTQPTGTGVIYIDSTNSNLLKVTINVSWRNKDNRVVGEDTDLDGAVDAGEDLSSPANSQLDSAVSLISYIAKR